MRNDGERDHHNFWEGIPKSQFPNKTTAMRTAKRACSSSVGNRKGDELESFIEKNKTTFTFVVIHDELLNNVSARVNATVEAFKIFH